MNYKKILSLLLAITMMFSLTSCITEDEFNAAIESAQTESYELGKAKGYETGYADGRAKGYETGFAEGREKGYKTGFDEGKASLQKQSSSYNNSYTVYITNTGSKYHRGSCHYLRYSSYAISVNDARASGYDPCKVCNP